MTFPLPDLPPQIEQINRSIVKSEKFISKIESAQVTKLEANITILSIILVIVVPLAFFSCLFSLVFWYNESYVIGGDIRFPLYSVSDLFNMIKAFFPVAKFQGSISGQEHLYMPY